jgi:hypothetical protein
MRSPSRGLSHWELVGAWLHIWTPPRDVPIPPVPRRKLAFLGLAAVAAVAMIIPAIESGKHAGAAERARSNPR